LGNDGDVHHRRLEDEGGHLIADLVEHALEHVGIVERDGLGELADGVRVAGSEGHAARRAALAELVQRRAHADHDGVVVAVVGALDLEHHVAPGGGAREVDGVHRRLGAGVGEAPLRQAEAALELLGHHDRALGRGGEVRPAPGALAHGGDDGRVGVAHAHHAEAVVEVDVLGAVHVPHVRALAVGQVDRPRVGGLE
jgi:hypothetical protein